LNQKNLSNFDITLKGSESIKIDKIEFDEKEEYIIMHTPKVLKVGEKYDLHIS